MALAAVAQLASARRDLYEFCNDLDRTLSYKRDLDFGDAKAVLKAAQSELRAPVNLGQPKRFKLATAWETALEVAAGGGQCGTRANELVSTIAECEPEHYGQTMHTFTDAAVEFSSKCLAPAFWTDQLKRRLSGFFGCFFGVSHCETRQAPLEKFLSDDFIAHYRRENPEEPPMDFYTSGGANCCQPEQSHKALLAAVKPLLPVEGKETLLDAIRHRPGKLVQLLDRHLFQPCRRYVRTLDKLMDQASNAAQYQKAGFIERQSTEFQNALFRFRYCSRFRYLASAQDKMDAIDIVEFF